MTTSCIYRVKLVRSLVSCIPIGPTQNCLCFFLIGSISLELVKRYQLQNPLNYQLQCRWTIFFFDFNFLSKFVPSLLIAIALEDMHSIDGTTLQRFKDTIEVNQKVVFIENVVMFGFQLSCYTLQYKKNIFIDTWEWVIISSGKWLTSLAWNNFTKSKTYKAVIYLTVS